MSAVIVNSGRPGRARSSALVGLAPFWPLPSETGKRGNPNRSDRFGGADRTDLARATIEARIALEEAVVAAAVAAQRAIDVAEALGETLAILAAAESPSTAALVSVADAGPEVEALSPREREVLALVAEGHTNKAIAEALFVSPNTVKSHVASLLGKLHAESRAQLAAIAARQSSPLPARRERGWG